MKNIKLTEEEVVHLLVLLKKENQNYMDIINIKTEKGAREESIEFYEKELQIGEMIADKLYAM